MVENPLMSILDLKMQNSTSGSLEFGALKL